MCGHATIALGRWAVDTGIVPKVEPVTQLTLQCPCGDVKVFVDVTNGKAGDVRFHSVPSFVFGCDMLVDVPGVGEIEVDVAYGGAFYAFLTASSIGLDIDTTPLSMFISVGMQIKRGLLPRFGDCMNAFSLLSMHCIHTTDPPGGPGACLFLRHHLYRRQRAGDWEGDDQHLRVCRRPGRSLSHWKVSLD